MTRASVFAAGSISLCLPSDWALFSVPCHLSFKGEPQNGKQRRGHHFVSHSTQFTNRFGQIWLTCQKADGFSSTGYIVNFLKDSEIISGQKKAGVS